MGILDPPTQQTIYTHPHRAVGDSNVNIASPGPVFDGITLSGGDRVLLIGQTLLSENGSWIFHGPTQPLTRPLDFHVGSTRQEGELFSASEGTTYGKTVLQLVTPNAVVGTTGLIFESPPPSTPGPGTITGSMIAAGTIIGSNIQAGTITGSLIQAATITGNLVAANTITGSKIAANTITASNIQANTITASEIAVGTITAAQIAANTITATNIQGGTITGSLIQAGTITGSLIAAGTITGSLIASNTVTATNIAVGTITGGLIAAGTITGTQIAANTILASNIAANTITAAQIATSTITANLLAANTISSYLINGNTIVLSSNLSNLHKVQLDPSGISGYNTLGTQVFSLDSTTGLITATGIVIAQAGSQLPVSTLTGSIPGSANRYSDSAFQDGQDTYSLTTPVGSWSADTSATLSDGGTTVPPVYGARTMKVIGAGTNAYVYDTGLLDGHKVVVPGQNYSFSHYVYPTTGRNGKIVAQWYDSSGTLVSQSTGPTQATLASQWNRVTATLQAPTGAVYGRGVHYVSTTDGLNGDVFYVECFQMEQGDQASAWAPRPDEILYNTINANMIQANAITATQIAAGTITASQIAAGTILGTNIAATTITAANIATGTITALQIAAGTITAGKLSVSQLSAITTDLGSITAGSITINGGVFNVDTAGNLSATSANITGTVTTSNLTVSGLGTGGINVHSGAFTVSNLGAVSATNMVITGGSLSIGANFSVTSSGVLTASGASIGGTMTAGNVTLGPSGITSASGNFLVDTSGNMTATTGLFTGSIAGASGVFTGNLQVGPIKINSAGITSPSGTFAIDNTGNLVAGSATFQSTKAFYQQVMATNPIAYFRLGETGNSRVALDIMGLQAPNLLFNPSLEADLVAWTTAGSGTIVTGGFPQQSSVWSQSGTFSYLVQGSTGTDAYVVCGSGTGTSAVPATVGTYTISAYANVQTATTGGVAMRAVCMSPTGAVLLDSTGTASTGTGVWRPTYTFTAPVGTAFIEVRLELIGNGQPFSLYVDAAMLTATGSVQPYYGGNGGADCEYKGTFTLNQTGALTVSGDTNPAVQFNAGYAKSVSSILGTGAFSIGAWVKTTSTTGTEGIAGNFTGSLGSSIGITNGNAVFWLNGSTVTAGAIHDGNWHRVVGTWDGSTASLYVDSTAAVTASFTGLSAGTNFNIGTFNNTAGSILMSVDEVVVNNYALSSSTVSGIYSAASLKNTVRLDSTGLNAYNAAGTNTVSITSSGSITINGVGSISGSTISGGSISGTTISGSTISGNTISGGSITIGSNFSVDSSGNMTASVSTLANVVLAEAAITSHSGPSSVTWTNTGAQGGTVEEWIQGYLFGGTHTLNAGAGGQTAVILTSGGGSSFLQTSNALSELGHSAGSSSVTLGSNSPAANTSGPFGWFQANMGGTTVWIPAWR